MRHVWRPLPITAAFVAVGAAIEVLWRAHAAWWLVPLGVIGPDLSFLAGIGGPANVGGLMPPRVVRPYNLVHRLGGPVALVGAATALRAAPGVVLGLSWAAHVFWDRGVGYGLRRSDGSIIEPRPVHKRMS